MRLTILCTTFLFKTQRVAHKATSIFSQNTTMTDAIPNAPPLYQYVFYQGLGLFVFALAILPVLLVRAVLHISPGTRPYPTWSLRRSLAIAGGRLYLACTTYASLPRPHGVKAWRPDHNVHKATGHGTKVKAIRVPPASVEWITGVAKVGQDIVNPEPVACFWTFCPSKDISEGDERAGSGERVIMYVAGGYVLYEIYCCNEADKVRIRSWVMGHPQSTMFPYKFAKESGRRVLGTFNLHSIRSFN